MHDSTIIEDLARFDAQFVPQGVGIRPGIDTLADAIYEFEILLADLTRTEKSREAILKLELRIVTGETAGQEVEHVYFFREQRGINRLGADLVALGIDAHQWTLANRRPFSQELPRHLGVLQGMRFRARKTTSQGQDRTFHNLQILNAATSARPMPAPVLSTEDNKVVTSPWESDEEEQGSNIPF